MIIINKNIIYREYEKQEYYNKMDAKVFRDDFLALVWDDDGRDKKISFVKKKMTQNGIVFKQCGTSRVWRNAEEINVVCK